MPAVCQITITRAIELLTTENTPYKLLTWNNCHGGGPNLSEEADKAYTEYSTSQGVDRGRTNYENSEDLDNVHLLRFIKHFRSENPKRRFADKYSAFAFALIKKEQAPFYKLSEYDGLETPNLDRKGYILHKIDVHFQQKDTMSPKEYAEYSRVEHEFINIEC